MAYSEFGRPPPFYAHQQPDGLTRGNTVSRGSRITSILIISLLALWSSATTSFLLFHDDALRFLALKQTEMVSSYDAQLTALESEIERLRSLKLIDQERVDRAILDLTRRQTPVEQRQKSLANLPTSKGVNRTDPLDEVTGSIPPTDKNIVPKPSPISDTILFGPPLDRSSDLHSRPANSTAVQFANIEQLRSDRTKHT